MRLKQFIMDEFDFNLDLETWGLTSQATELKRFENYISPADIAKSNALFGYQGDKYYFDVDIRRHFGQAVDIELRRALLGPFAVMDLNVADERSRHGPEHVVVHAGHHAVDEHKGELAQHYGGHGQERPPAVSSQVPPRYFPCTPTHLKSLTTQKSTTVRVARRSASLSVFPPPLSLYSPALFHQPLKMCHGRVGRAKHVFYRFFSKFDKLKVLSATSTSNWISR